MDQRGVGKQAPKMRLIVCVDKRGAIGRGNRLLGNFPRDLARFRRCTVGSVCVMGRLTFDSILTYNNSPLPSRLSYVLTRNEEYAKDNEFPTVKYFSNSAEALRNLPSGSDVRICGGSTVYREFLPLVDEIYITELQAEFDDADAHFYTVDELAGSWDIVEDVWIDDCPSEMDMRFIKMVRPHARK